MAQTENGMSFVAARAFVSADGATWTDVSDFGASVAVTGGDRVTGEQNTFVGDTPIVKSGKRGSLDLTCRYVYTEEAADPFEVLRAIYETPGGVCYAQYSPKDGFWFSTGAGVLMQFEYPGGDASSGDVVMGQFVMKCAALTKAAASS